MGDDQNSKFANDKNKIKAVGTIEIAGTMFGMKASVTRN